MRYGPKPPPLPVHRVELIGNIKSAEYHAISKLMLEIIEKNPHTLEFKSTPYTPFEYEDIKQKQKKHHPKLLDVLFPSVLTLYSPYATPENSNPSLKKLWDFNTVVEWASKTFNVSLDETMEVYQKKSEVAFKDFMKGLKHTIVYMEITIDKTPVGTLVIELYDSIVPKSVEHFLKFVNGTYPNPLPKRAGQFLSYSGKNIVRVIKEGWFQSGEFSDTSGTIMGEPFPDENFKIPHSVRGNLSFVNYGPHSNFSQYMITFKDIPYFNQKFVCFGRCIDGVATLKAIEMAETRFERPLKDVCVTKIGVLMGPGGVTK